MAKTRTAGTGARETGRGPVVRDWHAVAAIAAAVIFFFRDILLQKAFFWEDFIYQFYPFRHFAAVSIAHGELPLWNPYTFGGTPFQADIQSALFYIPNLLLSLLVSGGKLDVYWVELMIIFHYIIGGVAMYYLAKEIGIDRPAAIFSGIAYALSGFMITHAIHQVVICQVAWMPLVVLLFHRALTRSSVMHMVAAGLVLGHAVLAGFPQLSLYIFFFLFLWFVFEFTSTIRERGIRRSWSMAPLAAGVIVVALGLTALQLLPTIELAPLSQRAEITYAKSLEGSLSWSQLITVFVPKLFGSSGAEGSDYWGPGAYWWYWETCFYLGISALVLAGCALLAVRQNRYVLFFAVVGIFSVLYALGDGFIFHKFFFSVVPGFDKFRSIGRMTLLWTFCGSLLAGFGIRELIRIASSSPALLKKTAVIVAGAGIAVFIIVRSGSIQAGVNPAMAVQAEAMASSASVTMLLLMLAVAGLFLLLGRKAVSPIVLTVLLIVVQWIDMNIFGFTQNNGTTNPNEYYARSGRLVDMLREEGKHEYFRINSRAGGAMLLDRNQGMVDGIFMLEGYTPLALQRLYPPAADLSRIYDLMNAKYRISVDEQQRTMGLSTVTTYRPRAFLVPNQVVSANEQNAKALLEQQTFNPALTVVLEEQPDVPLHNGIPDSSRGTAVITSYHLNSITLDVNALRDEFLVLSEIYYPGWIATVDGVPAKIYRADWNLRAIPITQGHHSVSVRFEPASFARGCWITLITLACSAAVITVALFRKRRTQPGAPAA